MSKNRLVWSDQAGDLRKKKDNEPSNIPVNEQNLVLKVRRLTSGKGRTVVEITGLPANKGWCQRLAKDLKALLGVGGTYKQGYIEIHGEKLEQITKYFDSKSLKWKKTGG